MRHDHLKQLSDTEVSLNRLRFQKAALLRKLKKSDNKQRRARNRF